MPQIVEADIRKVVPLEQLLELVTYPEAVQGCADGAGEDQIVLLPAISCRGFQQFLLTLVSGHFFQDALPQFDLAASGPCLGRTENKALVFNAL